MATNKSMHPDWQTDGYHYSIIFFNHWLFFFIYLHTFPLSSRMLSGGGLSRRAVNSPGIILDAAQGQTEGHVPTQLLRRSHESLQIILQTATQGVDRRVTHRQVLYLTFFFVSVVYDSRWSTGWSLGSSSTSHPPLLTLPTHLQQKKTAYY